MKKKIAALFLGALLLSSVAWAQGSITAGDVTFTWNGFGVDFDNSNFTAAAAGPDHMFENWWYTRVAGDLDEIPMPGPDTQNYAAAVATLGWNDVNSRGLFSAQLVSTVSAGAGGIVRHDLTITNIQISGAPLNLEVFAYLDFDLTNTSSEDAATLLNAPDYIRVFDAMTEAEYQGTGAAEFQVTDTQSGAGSLRSLFFDGLPTNLDGTGLPFGPGDWEGAFQWSVTLNPMGQAGDSVTLRREEAVGQMIPVELMTFEIE